MESGDSGKTISVGKRERERVRERESERERDPQYCTLVPPYKVLYDRAHRTLYTTGCNFLEHRIMVGDNRGTH